jgi:hypothetical protein
MSTPRSEQRKSARVKQESFAQEYQKLQDAAAAAKAKQKPAIPKLELRDINGSDSPKKTQDQSAWKSSQSDRSVNSATTQTQTQTQTITTTQTTTTTQTDPMAHTAPVITPRKQTRFAPETSSDGGPSQEKTSARSEKAVDSPRRMKIRSREPVQSKRSGSPSVSTTTTPSSSPAVTPREKDQVESPRGVKAIQFRKRVSTQFSKVALNVSKAIDEISPRKTSPKNSPASAGRSSPTKYVSRTPREKLPVEFTNTLCNEATKLILKLQKDQEFRKVSPSRQNLLFHATLMKMLEEKNIPCDLKKLDLFSSEIRLRSQNAIVNVEIDLTKEPYLGPVNEIKGYLKDNFGANADRGDVYDLTTNEEKQKMELNFESYFIRDMSSKKVELEYETDDGNIESFGSIWDLEVFLNKGDPESEQAQSLIKADSVDQEEVFTRSRYISHFASQHVFGFMGKVGLGMLPGLPSPFKLDDGAEIIPKGDVQIRYRFKKHVDGGVDVQIFYEMKPDPIKEIKTKDGRFVSIDPDARLTLSMDLYFSRDRDMQTSAIRINAEGWNLTVPGKFDKID